MKKGLNSEQGIEVGTKGQKLLVITTQNIFSENGARSLMRGKARALSEQGVSVKFFCLRFGGVSSKQRAAAGVEVAGTGTSEGWLLRLGVLSDIRATLRTYRPDWVLVSGAWLYLWGDKLGRVISLSGACIAVDLQGPIEEIAEYRRVLGSRLLARLLSRWLCWAEHRFLSRWTHLVETMSGNAVRYLSKYRPRYDGSVSLVKCGFSEAFTDARYARERVAWRKKLGIGADKRAVVFAGTLSGWQNKEGLFAFAKRHSGSEDKTEVHFFVPRAHHAEIAALGLRNTRTGFLPSAQLQVALCAFDYGLLLRQARGIANYFAFPLKASEYANARLGILSNSDDENSLGWMEGSLARAFVDIETFPLSEKKLASVRLRYEDLRELEFSHMVVGLIELYGKIRRDLVSSKMEVLARGTRGAFRHAIDIRR